MNFEFAVSLFSGFVGVLIGVIASELISEKEMKVERYNQILDVSVNYFSALKMLRHKVINLEDNINVENRKEKQQNQKPEYFEQEIVKINGLLSEIDRYKYKLEILFFNDVKKDRQKVEVGTLYSKYKKILDYVYLLEYIVIDLIIEFDEYDDSYLETSDEGKKIWQEEKKKSNLNEYIEEYLTQLHKELSYISDGIF